MYLEQGDIKPRDTGVKKENEIIPENIMVQATFDRLSRELNSAQERLLQLTSSKNLYFESAQDYHDNAPLDALEDEITTQAANVYRLMTVLNGVEVIGPRLKATDVGIANTVILKFTDEPAPVEYTILGMHDSGTNPSWISYKSPLGSRLIGALPGQELCYKVGNNEMSVTVLSIKPGKFEGPVVAICDSGSV